MGRGMSRVFVIAQGGGPTAVINQTVAGAALAARERHPGSRVLGARHGVRGIAAGDYVDLSALSEADLRRFADTPNSGLGSTRDKPQNFAAIKEFLLEEGMQFNRTNAWYIELVPERGSMRERLEARDRNKAFRERLEDVILPTVVGLEEEKRGPVESDVLRERINQLRAGHGR